MLSTLPTTQLPPAQLLALIERRALDTQPLPQQPIFGQLDGAVWWQVLGLARFWEPRERGAVVRCIEDVLTGLHGSGAVPMMLLHTMGGELCLYYGVQAEHGALLEPALRGGFPGIILADNKQRLGTTLQKLHAFAYSGQITGIPTLKVVWPESRRKGVAPQPPVQQIERLIRGMGRARWGYYLRATPAERTEALHWSAQTLELLKVYDEQARMTHQIRDGLSIQGDRQAQLCVTLLERQLERLECGKVQGLWHVEASFFAPDTVTLAQLTSLLRAIFAGDDSHPEPLRVRAHQHSVPSVPLDQIRTVLHSAELATLMQFPTEEAPGYQVRDYARFDLALPLNRPGVARNADAINIGEVLDGELPTGQKFSMPHEDFAKHGLIVGVTGSGKTNTCFGVLEQIWSDGRGEPFLVIEPAKAEYRSMLSLLPAQLRIYTLGDERYAPFRLNPFEFECQGAAARIHVQTHIDYLKSIFNAAFILYAPMPYVLETCLHQIYVDRGWNLTTSAIERRLPPAMRGREAEYPVFPTLQDLYAKIDPVVDHLGYDNRIQQDVKAGLKARIGSLLLGGKGLMLNTRRSIPIGALLRTPTILELERVGDDDEKAFLIGLLLTRIYEYRVVEGRTQTTSDERLRHVLLIEEAHRLLQNISTSQDTESANPRGKAVESFANMLAEIRAYGQGVLIAEQIPTKLTPDAIKNTNLKVLHRTVAVDERQVMAGAMNLNEAQTRAIATLRTGQAAVYAEGADRPYLLRIAQTKGTGGCAAKPTDVQVRQTMVDLHAFDQAIYQPRPGCERCGLWKNNPARCAMVRSLALAVEANRGFVEAYRRYILSLGEEPTRAVQGYPDLLQSLKQAVRLADDQELRESMLCALVHHSVEQVEEQGEHYTIPYDALAELHDALVSALAPVVKNFQNDQAALLHLLQHVEPKANSYGQIMRKLTEQPSGPFAGCIFCQHKCRYRFGLAPLADDAVLQRDVVDALEHIQDDEQMWSRLADICREAAARAISVSDPEPANAAALCFASQVGAALRFNSESQRKLAKKVRDTLAATKGARS